MKRRVKRSFKGPRAIMVILASLGLMICSSALGQSKAPKVIELDEDVIKGKVQKPEAFYILQHASLNYKRLDPKETFIPELVESVREDAF